MVVSGSIFHLTSNIVWFLYRSSLIIKLFVDDFSVATLPIYSQVPTRFLYHALFA
jgi:hypothetical protein